MDKWGSVETNSQQILIARGNLLQQQNKCEDYIATLGEEPYKVPFWASFVIVDCEAWNLVPLQVSGFMDPLFGKGMLA